MSDEEKELFTDPTVNDGDFNTVPQSNTEIEIPGDVDESLPKLILENDTYREDSGVIPRIRFKIPNVQWTYHVWIRYENANYIQQLLNGEAFRGDDWKEFIYPGKFPVGDGKYVTRWSHRVWESVHGYKQLRVLAEPVVDGGGAVILVVSAISGSVGAGSRVRIVRASDKTPLSIEQTAPASGRWTLDLLGTLSWGADSIAIEQKVGTSPIVYSSVENLIFLKAPAIDYPAQNAVVSDKGVIVLKGRGAPGEVIEMLTPGGGHLFGAATVRADFSWEMTFNKNEHLNGGSIVMTARHRRAEGNKAWSADRTFFLLVSPSINTPPAVVDMNVTITGKGHIGIGGHTVRVYRDGVTGSIGSGSVDSTSGAWSAAVLLPPGRQGITASQFYLTGESERADPVYFLVRPPQPTITSSLNGETVTLSGIGYSGFDVLIDIYFEHGGSAYKVVPVTSGLWSLTLPLDLLPGPYRFSGKQSVSNGGSGRIFGEWGTTISANVPTPVPKDVTVVTNGQLPTFKGKGRRWSTHAGKINIFVNGSVLNAVPQVDVQQDSNWTTTATTKLAPGIYPLTARQWVNNQWSGNSRTFSLTVASPIPEFTSPPATPPSDQLPLISGTAWPGSAILLKISGKDDVTLTAEGGTFSLSATVDWAPKTYILTATAAFGWQTSQPATRTFTVKTPKPVITTADNAEVDLVPVIKGTGYKGCWVVIYSASNNQSLGAGEVGEDHKWEVSLAEHTPAILTVYAIQQESQGTTTNNSEKSEPLTVKVRVPKPVILVPGPGGRPTRKTLISGTAPYSEGIRGSVKVSIKGQTPPLADTEVTPDGTWEAKVTIGAAGPVNLVAELWQKTYASEPVEFNVTVVPDIPVFDTPLDGEDLGRWLTVSGYGYEGDTLRIYRRATDTHLADTIVAAAGTWSAKILHGMSAGQGIGVQARANSQEFSDFTPTRLFRLLTPAPQIIEPQAGDWVGIRPLFSGLATPGATITVAQWFNTEALLAPLTQANELGVWAVMGNKDLPVGAARVVVRETVDGKPSEWFESGRFMVERKTADFDAPIVHFPREGQEVGKFPMFSGTGEPGAGVVIVKEGELGTQLGRTLVDRDGQWALRSQVELPADIPYRYSVRQFRDDVNSKWVVPNRSVKVIRFYNGFTMLIIDKPVNDPLQVLEQQPVFSGRGMPGAELQVSIRSSTTVLATTRVDAQGNWRVRSAAVLPVKADAYVIAAQQFMDGHASVLSDISSTFKVAEKLDKPVITSPPQRSSVAPHAVIRGTALPGAEVKLYRHNHPNVVWGRGVADEQGQWVIVMNELPVGDNFQMAGKAYKGTLQSPWMDRHVLHVIDIG